MDTTRDRGSLEVGLPVVTPREIAAYVRQGGRLRDEEISKLLRAAGRGLARLARGAAGLATGRGRGTGAVVPHGGLGQPAR